VARKPTVGDILKLAKQKADAKRKSSLKKTRKVTDRLPIKGPIGLGVDIAELASLVSQELVNQAADIAFQDLRSFSLPGKTKISQEGAKMNTASNTPPSPRRKRTDKQLINDEIMRTAMKNANSRARKKNGQLKKGMTQKKIARMAQRECTKERQRLGLCEKPMKKRKRK
jgi:hypothetical protein